MVYMYGTMKSIMIENNSGKIYVIPLEFKLGFTLGKFVDYTDIAPFDGALIYVLNKQFYDVNNLPSSEEIELLKVLFGPVPLNKYINEKGKGAWKKTGKIKVVNKSLPVFKDTNQILTLNKSSDWSTVGGWRKRYFNQGEGPFDYEDVRHLEMLTLYDMRNVEIRATMHFLLLNNLKIGEYYDLRDENYKTIYLQMVNTSFDKKEAKRYLKFID